ncbi:pyrroline-5-carboxylate reductase [Kiritimatiella glycovorans]|uniref:Pyrroline-5-carboxylate reductase n=1 Tax=Kiritimatiella glycovorans TaxID=1307763 RepID=A0A0G3EHN9_9BACT|nr:pyrroline-5-carboxylate reductase [Kiritimatiella glycovorans]AKJ64310.1 Pyrroline-5-carboxylate reductase [Kiritimatiella glycovorans]
MKLQDSNIAFIGAGNMTEAIVRGLLDAGEVEAGRICVSDVDPGRRALFSESIGVEALEDNRAAAESADAVLLAVKPQILGSVLEELSGSPVEDKLVISIAAGVRTRTIEEGLRARTRVVRVMPNTPALIGRGAAAYAAGRAATEADTAFAAAVMQSVGVAVPMGEEALDAVTALSGSGPAYVFYLLEAMLDAAKTMGLPDPESRKLALATVKGAADLMGESGEDAAVLRARVTSPGGTTEAALGELERAGVKDAVIRAMHAAEQRSKELAGDG